MKTGVVFLPVGQVVFARVDSACLQLREKGALAEAGRGQAADAAAEQHDAVVAEFDEFPGGRGAPAASRRPIGILSDCLFA